MVFDCNKVARIVFCYCNPFYWLLWLLFTWPLEKLMDNHYYLMDNSHKWKRWFAWHPVRLPDGLCHWMKFVERSIPQKNSHSKPTSWEGENGTTIYYTQEDADLSNIRDNYYQYDWQYMEVQ